MHKNRCVNSLFVDTPVFYIPFADYVERLFVEVGGEG